MNYACACGNSDDSIEVQTHHWDVVKDLPPLSPIPRRVSNRPIYNFGLLFYSESIFNGRHQLIPNRWQTVYAFRRIEQSLQIPLLMYSDIVRIGFCIRPRCQRIKRQMKNLSLCVWLQLVDINHIVCVSKQFCPSTCSQSIRDLTIVFASELRTPLSGFWEGLDGRLICRIRRRYAIIARTQAIVCCSQFNDCAGKGWCVQIRALKPTVFGYLKQGGNEIHWEDGDVWFWTGLDIDQYSDCCIDTTYDIPLRKELVRLLRYNVKGAWIPIAEVVDYLDDKWSLKEICLVARADSYRFETLQRRFIRAT